MKVRFSNFNDWYRALLIAPKQVRDILLKAYPEYKRQADTMYKEVFEPIKEKAQSTIKSTAQGAKKVTGNIPKQIGTATKAVSKVAPVVSKAAKFGKVLKSLSVPGIVGTATELGLDYLNKHPEKIVYNDSAYNNFERRYGTPDLPNFTNLAPQLKPLTNEQDRKWIDYQNAQMGQAINSAQQAIAANKQAQAESDDYVNRMNKSMANADNILAGNINIPEPSIQRSNAPSPGSYSANPPIVDLRRKAPVPQEQGVPIGPKQDIPIEYQQALMANVDPSELVYRNRQAGGTNFLRLQDEVGNKIMMNNNQPNNQGLQLYANILGEQRAQQQQLAEQRQAQYQELLDQYNKAVARDNRINAINSFANGLDRYLTGPDTVYYVGANGNVNRIDMGGDRPKAQTNTKQNQEEFLNRYALQQQALQQQAAVQGGINPQDIKDLMVAQAMGNKYNQDPVLFLDKDLAKTYMGGRNTIENTQTKGQLDREMVPLQTLADITKGNYNQANALELEGIKGQNDLARQQLQNEGFINTALINAQSREGIAEMQARNSNAQLKARLQAQQAQFEQSLKHDLDMLKARGANEAQLFDYKQKALMNSPMAQAELAVKYATGAATAMSPSEYAQAYQQGLGLLGGEVQAPQLSPSQIQMYRNLGLVE